MRAKRGEYTESDFKSFSEVISVYNNKEKPTYKLACLFKLVGFKKFRRYMIDKHGFDPDDVDREFSLKVLEKGMFYKYFASMDNMYGSRMYIDMYLAFYRTAKQNNLDLKDRFLLNKVNEIKMYDKFSIQRLKERYSLIPAEAIK